MQRSRVIRVVGVACFAAALLRACPLAPAQDAEPAAASESETAEEASERIAAERFSELLKKRPRLGTALDKVYGYHVGRGTLEEFAAALKEDAAAGDDGTSWLILGMVEMQRGQDAAAAVALENAEKLLPDEPLASYYLGKTLVVLGEVDRAAEAMRRAIERKPARADLLSIFQDLGRIYQRTGRNAEALEVWKQLEALFPGDVQVREQIAGVLAEEGATEAALQRYTKLADSVKDRFRQVELAIRAAQLKAELGRTEEALADFEKLLARVNPDSWLHRDIRRRIEEVFWASGDIDGLVTYYTGWIERHPDDYDAMMRAARVLSAQRRLPEAEKWFRDAIAKAPSTAEPRLALAEALAADDRYAEAAREMEKLVELEPDNPDYVVRWGELVFNDTKRSEQQRRDEAGKIWRRMLEKRGDDPVTVARVADLLRASGAAEAAIDEYRAATELAPGDPQYREYLGEYLHQLGRKDEALAAWRELASGDRETRDNLVRLSEVLSTFRYTDEALATMAQACRMNPTFGHRTRYAELLRHAKRYDEALAQLDLAEPLAEDPELRELVVEERIQNYQASGKLAQRIEETETAVAGDGAQDVSRWRLLALLRNADRKFQRACQAIEKAAELAPRDVAVWETAALLQERAGRFGDAIASYRKLATLDRRYLTNYLTQIASLEMRLGNTEAALKTGEQLVAAAPGNSDHYRFFADLCFQSGNAQRGFDALRRNVRSHPNDQDALVYLARMLADDFATDEAIELYWRAFGLAGDLDGKNAVIAPLAELYLRTNRFEAFTDRLETIGREQNKPREGILWVAAAHQAAGDLGMAKQLLERLVREDSRDTKLLEQLVSLARAEFDFATAAEYQKRLVAAAPSPEAEYLLGNILLELGEVDQAEVLWLKLSQRAGNPEALTASISTLLGKEQYETAAKVIEKAIARQPGDWELLAPAMIAYVKLDRKPEARRLAQRALALNVDPAEPTKKVAEAIKKQASRRSAQSVSYAPYANLGNPTELVRAAQRVKQTFDGTARGFAGRQNVFTPNCFGDVQALAYCIPLVAAEKGFDEAAFIKQYVTQALASRAAGELWRAILYLNWQDPRAQYAQTVNEDYEKCLQALIDKEDPYAASSRITQFVNQRRVRSGGDAGQIDPLTPEEIEQLKHLSNLASSVDQGNNNYYNLFVALELYRAGEEEEAEKLIDDYVASTPARTRYSQMTALQAMGLLISEMYNPTPSPGAIEKATELFRLALADLKIGTNSAGMNYGRQIATLIRPLVEHGRPEDALQIVDDLLKWQAEQTAALRPSQRERLQSNNRGPMTYNQLVGGRYTQVTVTFPPVSGYFGAEAIFTLHAFHEACKDDATRRAALRDALDRWVAEPTDDPFLRVARLMASAAMAYWSGEHQQTAEALSAVRELQQVDPQFVGLAQSRLLYDSGKIREALAMVEKLRPTNQRMLVDRELAILQLVLQLGDLERARQSAQKLFALRLDSDTEFKLADLMYQLGMRELGDRMMGRIRRRAGGQRDTLVQLMTRYAQADDKEAAAEIARQVIRRTSPRGSQDYYTTENQQHEQAVRVLAQAGMLEPLIEQYEGLVERSPRSTKLVDELCAYYEAAGRRDDAQKLRLQAVEAAPDDPRSLYAAGQQLSRLRQYDEAADKFTAAIVKSPELFDRSYYEMRSTFQQAQAWNRLADAIVGAGLKTFSQSYRIGELCSELVRAQDHEAYNRLLYAALSELNWSELSQTMYSLSRGELKPDEKLVQLVGDKLTAPDAAFENLSHSAFVWSRSSNGRTSGFVDGVAQIVSADDQLRERVAAAMAGRLKKSPEQTFPRVLLCLLRADAGQFDQIEETVRPLLEKENKTQNEFRAVWCVASMLAHRAKQPALACRLLEAVGPKAIDEHDTSGFQYSATSLLAFAYGKADQKTDAHRVLVEAMKTMSIDETQSQHNPGYGEYQYIDSMRELSERFLEMGFPAEAFIAYRKAFADENLMDRAGRWTSGLANRQESLRKQIGARQNNETMLEVIKATLDQDNAAEGTSRVAAAYLTEPTIERHSLIDNRVSMPLEHFTHEVADNQALRQALSKWLRESPLPDDPAAVPLKKLVTRLLVSDAAGDPQQTAAAAAAIAGWVESHDPPEPSASLSENASKDRANQPSSAERDKQADRAPPALPDELLLGMAALRIPTDAVEAADVVTMLNRAIAAAKARNETALVGSLECQIAIRLAPDEPDRARAVFQQALDELLPADEKQQADAANATKEAK